MTPEAQRPPLTPRQQKILDAIRTEIEQKGYPLRCVRLAISLDWLHFLR